jgi:integrase
MIRKELTDKYIKGLKLDPGKRYQVHDVIVPPLAVRVTENGVKSFILVKRYPGSKQPARRVLGQVGVLGLADAREMAREWLLQIKKGSDPRKIARAARAAEEEKRRQEEAAAKSLFGEVGEIFLAAHVYGRKLRQARPVERRIRNELVPHWGDLSVHRITREDVEDLLLAIVKRPAPGQARSVLGDLKMFFGWLVDVVDRRKPYKLQVSPCDRIRAAKLIGPRRVRVRVLNDAELRALWRACEKIGYPFGPLVLMLMLTGCRLSEVAGARWPEVGDTHWVVPPERFKTGIEHRVPITTALAELLRTLPRFKSGDCLFSTRFGRIPVGGFSGAKKQIDAHMPAGTPLWSFHDIRRTVRTRLSQLKVVDHVAELCIGHGRKGMQKIYDQFEFTDEIAEAMTAWTNLLRRTVDPQPNVVGMPPKKRKAAP